MIIWHPADVTSAVRDPQGSRLLSVHVEGLFGTLDHTVNLQQDQHLTILHGPNGVGKTTLLRIIDGVFRRQFGQVRQLPFSRAAFSFLDGGSLQVTRWEIDREGRNFPELEFIGKSADGVLHTHTAARRPVHSSDVPPSALTDFIPLVERVGARQWLDLPSGDLLDFEDVLDRYRSHLPAAYREQLAHEESPDWLKQRLDALPTAYIKAQRLSMPDRAHSRARRDTSRETPTVSVFSSEVVTLIAGTLARYAEYSQSLDSTFPSRVLEQRPDLDAHDIRRRYKEQSERRAQYVAVGLLEGSEAFALPERDFNEGELRVLTTVLEDIDRKLDQLQDLAGKIALFQDIVNSKFRRKKLAISRQAGFVVTAETGDTLALTALSSGEQQELVLAYELLFRHPPGTLVLVDEPELSLHVSWQMGFISDLLKVARLTELSFIVATHSPQIINDRWDLTCELRDE